MDRTADGSCRDTAPCVDMNHRFFGAMLTSSISIEEAIRVLQGRLHSMINFANAFEFGAGANGAISTSRKIREGSPSTFARSTRSQAFKCGSGRQDAETPHIPKDISKGAMRP